MVKSLFSYNETGIYLISPTNIDKKNFPKILYEVLATKFIKIFQLRLKKTSDAEIIEIINILYPICIKYKVPFILNDRVDLTKKTGIDGVHLGKKDLDIRKARKLLGNKKIIGSSCYNNIFLSIKSAHLGANYLAFGSFFETTTKEKTKKVNISNLNKYRKFHNIPLVAIGGLNKFNITKLKPLNFDFLAFCSSIWYNKNSPIVEIKEISKTINRK